MTVAFELNPQGSIHSCKKIPRRIRERGPSARAMAVVQDPVPEIRSLAGDHVEVTGTLDDVRATVLRGSVFVGPLHGGTGQKNKILRARATALPIVATPGSVTGLESQDGEDLLVAKYPDDLAAACAGLLESAHLWRSIGKAERRTALDTYTVERRPHMTQDLLERALRCEFPNASAAPS